MNGEHVRDQVLKGSLSAVASGHFQNTTRGIEGTGEPAALMAPGVNVEDGGNFLLRGFRSLIQ